MNKVNKIEQIKKDLHLKMLDFNSYYLLIYLHEMHFKLTW